MEYEVEQIIEKRIKENKTEFLVKWKGHSSESNTWEREKLLKDFYPDILASYLEKESKSSEKKSQEPSPAAKKFSLNIPKKSTQKKGFARGLIAEKILGATDTPGELMFLMKWKGDDVPDMVRAKEANKACPQVVIAFYEQRLSFINNPISVESMPE